MSEAEKKGSPWPWILVPISAVGLFFVLRECRQNLPPAGDAAAPVTAPASPDVIKPAEPAPVEPAPAETAPAQTPAPQ